MEFYFVRSGLWDFVLFHFGFGAVDWGGWIQSLAHAELNYIPQTQARGFMRLSNPLKDNQIVGIESQ